MECGSVGPCPKSEMSVQGQAEIASSRYDCPGFRYLRLLEFVKSGTIASKILPDGPIGRDGGLKMTRAKPRLNFPSIFPWRQRGIHVP